MGHVVNNSSKNESYKYLDETALSYLRYLSIATRGAVDGTYAGKHKSVVKGRSQEFNPSLKTQRDQGSHSDYASRFARRNGDRP